MAQGKRGPQKRSSGKSEHPGAVGGRLCRSRGDVPSSLEGCGHLDWNKYTLHPGWLTGRVGGPCLEKRNGEERACN